MARQLRVEFPGAIYHVTCRMLGDGRMARSRLFRDEKDRQRFVVRLAERVEQYNIRLYLFVLMTNHVHLVFETPQANCGRFLHSLSTAYTVYYNRRHRRHGHLLDGRYKAKLVDGEEYLLALSRYVHLNPVKVGALAKAPLGQRLAALRAHAWSSYPGYIGMGQAWPFVTTGPVLAQAGGTPRQWAERYRTFVETGLTEDDAAFRAVLKQSPRSLGSDGFRAYIDRLYQKRLEGRRRPEDIAFRRVTEPLPAPTILAGVARVLGVDPAALRQRRRHSVLRAVAVRMLLRYGGQTQRQAAEELGMRTGGAASAQARRLPGLLERSGTLRRQVARIERQLGGLRTAPAAGTSAPRDR
jgi:REP element-mobilizing transposase RayT